jgi:TonB-dependent receptor
MSIGTSSGLAKLAFSFLLTFFIMHLSLPAQGSGSIKGRVLDNETGSPLFGANLVVQNTSLGASTDLDGRFNIRSVPAGERTLRVSYVGYVAVTLEVTVTADSVLEQDFRLEARAITGQTIVVTAQARGQEAAINQQLASNTIANVVSQARIKELPDVNAAESIGRLPGVSIERSGGEANKVEVRGLDPKYTLITVNGVNLPATSTSDRSVDLSLISSNMLDGIVLKKAITPDMDADVIGGTIDLRLKEAPVDPEIHASAQGGYNQLQSYYKNYNFNLSASSRFFDGRLGVIANGNADNYDRSADKFQDSWNIFGATGQIVTGELQLREEKVNRKRAGASLVADYLIPNGKIVGNGFYNHLKSDGQYHINDIWTPSAPYSTDRHFYQLEQTNSTTNVFTSAVGINQDFGWFHYDATVARSGTHYDNPNDRVWRFDQEAGAVDSTYTPTSTPIQVAQSASGASADTNGTVLAYLYLYSRRLTENQTSTQANFEVPLHLGEQFSGYIKTGGKIRWINRTNDQNQVGNGGLQYGNSSSNVNAAFVYLNQLFPQWKIDSLARSKGTGVPITPFLIDYTRSNFLNGQYPLGLIYDQTRMNQMMDALIAAPDSLKRGTGIWLPYSIGSFGNDYDGVERYQAAYLMGQFSLGHYLSLLPGVRWEREYTLYHGERYAQVQAGQAGEQPPAEFTRLSTERTNSFWLPMVNAIIKPNDWLQVRLSRTSTLARPDYLEYAPISYISADHSYVQAANAGLKTSQSTNYDGSVSVFNNSIGLLSVDGFYKKVKDLVFYAAFKLPKGGTLPDTNLIIPSTWYSESSPQVNTYLNNPDPATYYGYEVEWQTHFWYLPSVLNGLVLNVNYSHIFSQMKLQYDSLIQTTVPTPRPHIVSSLVPREITTRMPDQPAHILNITLGYDIGGFSARLSYLFQTDKLSSIGYSGVVPTTALSTYAGAYSRWDLTVQQKLGEHMELFANFTNLNNRPDQNFVGSALTSPSYIEYYGFTMDVGLRYSL